MALVKAVKTMESPCSIENVRNLLLLKLDEALDDMEHGRVLDEDDLWAEIDEV